MEKLFFDGAFGTYIASKGLELEYPEAANLSHPETVVKIHREYIAAGANAVKTNTFAANGATVPNAEKLRAIIEQGWALANTAAADTGARVFADMGPIAGEDAAEQYVFLAELFVSLGAKNFLFETLSEASALKSALEYIKNTVENSTVIVSFAVSQDGYTKQGGYYKQLLGEARAMGADCVGLNCICGPAHMLRLMREAGALGYPLSAMPNAGYPSIVGGRTVYLDNPEYFAGKLAEIYSLGVRAVGGCCGTTPEHIRRFMELADTAETKKAADVAAPKPVAAAPRNDFDHKVIAVEISAPVDADAEWVISAAKQAKASGADFVTIPDSPMGKTRANSFMIASMIQRLSGIKAIPHVCCRDKNQIAIKGDLLAANIEGITTALAITGDSVAEADRNDAKNVFGFNSFRLISFIRSLNETVFTARPYNICAALNINAANFEVELKRAQRKIDEGAVCLFTQPIFSEDNIQNYLLAKKTLNCKMFAGIMLLAGYKNALFLNNEVPGIEIPESVLSALKDKDADETRRICVSYAKGIADRIDDGCDGYYIMTPLKKIDFSAELVKYLRGEKK